VHKSNVFLPDDLDCVNGTKLAKIFTQLLLSDLLGQVSEVDIPRGARLLDSESNRCGNLRGFAPTNLDILALDAELFQDGIRVEMRSGARVQERDEGAVLIREQADRLDLAATDMAQDLLGRCVGRDVAKVHSAASACDDTGTHVHWRGGLHWDLHLAPHAVVRRRGRLGRVELGSSISRRRDDGLVELGRDALLHWARGAILLLLLLLLVGMLKVGHVLKVRAGESSGCSGLEGAAEEQLRGKQGGELHVESRAGGSQIGAVGRSLLHGLRVNGRNIPAPRMPIGKARNVRSESAMREACIAVGGLGGMAEARGGARPRLRTVQVLHPEQMRRDQRVPRDVR